MASQMHFILDEMEDYGVVWSKEYPNDMDKSNYGLQFTFRRAASTFTITK